MSRESSQISTVWVTLGSGVRPALVRKADQVVYLEPWGQWVISTYMGYLVVWFLGKRPVTFGRVQLVIVYIIF